jgi:hypothetical protein
MDSITKKCTKCGKEKQLSEFYKDTKRSGFVSQCKMCCSVRAKEYRLKNLEEVRIKKREYESSHRDKARIRLQKWRANNPERDNEVRLKSVRKWRAENPERSRSLNLLWHHANPEKAKQSTRNWRAKNPEKVRTTKKNRAARKKGAIGIITVREWNDMKELYGFTCLRCKLKEPEIELTLDHVMPLVMGGSNMISNAQPLCRTCNGWKQGRHIDYR